MTEFCYGHIRAGHITLLWSSCYLTWSSAGVRVNILPALSLLNEGCSDSKFSGIGMYFGWTTELRMTYGLRSTVHAKGALFERREVRGAAQSAKDLLKRQKSEQRLRKLLNRTTSAVWANTVTALIFSGSGWMPPVLTMWPKIWIWGKRDGTLNSVLGQQLWCN